MEKIGVAYIGFRHPHIFSLYEKLWHTDCVAVCGAFEENEAAKKDAMKKGVVFRYERMEDLLSDDAVSVVAIGDCYGRRGAIALRALQAGKHVFADKPLCTDMEALQKIRQLAAQKNLAVGLMLDLRDDKAIVTAGNAIRSGLIGKVNNIVFEAQHPLQYGTRPPWYFEKGMHGGTINDIAVHGIDLIRRFTGEEPVEVTAARTWNFYAQDCPDFKDSAQFMLRLTGGAGVIGDVSYAAPEAHGYTHPAYWHFRVWGTDGMLDFRPGTDDVHAYLAGEEAVLSLPGQERETDYFADFLQAVRDEQYRAVYTADILQTTQQSLRIQEKAQEE